MNSLAFLDGWLQSRNGKTLHWCCGGRALCGCKNSKLGWRTANTTTKCKDCEWRLRGVADGLLERIQSYLGNGGLFNPEMMEHNKVRDLIMDCRDYINGTKPMRGYWRSPTGENHGMNSRPGDTWISEPTDTKERIAQ